MSLAPLPYHLALVEFLQQQQAEVWNWFADHLRQENLVERTKFELLKQTYRLDESEHPQLYGIARAAADSLDLKVPLQLYQAQNPLALNASLVELTSEAHIVLHGPISTRLTTDELTALLAHELSHLAFWRISDGHFHVADRMLEALCNDPEATPAHEATARLFRLYTEIYCDRGAVSVVGDPHTIIAMLVKTITDSEQVNPAKYLEQAEEIFDQSDVSSEGHSHPECFIRARAAALFKSIGEAANSEIARMIQGTPTLESFDLLGQRQLTTDTRSFLTALTGPKWFQTDTARAHARLFFEDFQFSDSPQTLDSLVQSYRPLNDSLAKYFCFLLLDFVSAERDLEDLPLAQAYNLAEQLDIVECFTEMANKELKIGKRQLRSVHSQRADILKNAETSS